MVLAEWVKKKQFKEGVEVGIKQGRAQGIKQGAAAERKRTMQNCAPGQRNMGIPEEKLPIERRIRGRLKAPYIASASSSTRCFARFPVPCSTCWRHDTPSITSSNSPRSCCARTAGNSDISPMLIDIS